MKKGILLILIGIIEVFSNISFSNIYPDTNTVNDLNAQALDLAYSNPQRALQIVRQTVALSQKIDFKKGEIQALIREGIIFDVLSKTDEAIQSYNKALKISRSVGYKKGEGSILNNIGLIYMDQHDLTKARIYFQQAFDIFKALQNNQLLASISNNLGMIYAETNRNQQALYYFKIGLKYASKTEDQIEKANIFANLGDLYNGIQNDSSLLYNLKAVEIYEAEKNAYYLGKSYNNIALIYNAINKEKEAEKYFQKSIEISKSIGNKFMQVSSGYNLSQLYHTQQDSKREIKILNEIYPLIEPKGMSELAFKVCQVIAIWNYRNGKIEVGDKYFGEYLKYHADYFNEKNSQALTEIEKKFELQKKEQENMLLKKSNQLKSLKIKKNQQHSLIQNLIWTAGLVFILFVSLLVIFWFRKKSY